ncbi:MAG: hypothetical protein GTO54_09755 [Nitrososphaeria archaeon]|nr:hypothetical protein [Nitrososphaeria archaeon]
MAMVGTRAVRDASSAIDEIVSVVDVCKPASENREKYNRLYSVHKRLHDSMQAFYDRLEEIQV